LWLNLFGLTLPAVKLSEGSLKLLELLMQSPDLFMNGMKGLGARRALWIARHSGRHSAILRLRRVLWRTLIVLEVLRRLTAGAFAFATHLGTVALWAILRATLLVILRLWAIELRASGTLRETGTALGAKLRAVSGTKLWATLGSILILGSTLGAALRMALGAAFGAVVLRAFLTGAAWLHTALAGVILTGAALGRAIGALAARAGIAGGWALEVSGLLILLLFIRAGGGLFRGLRPSPGGDGGEGGKDQSAAK